MKNRNGFTFIELLLAIVIVGVFFGILLTTVGHITNEQNEWCHKELSVSHTPQDSITLFKLHPVCLNYLDTLIHK